jgi:hypothetical protein
MIDAEMAHTMRPDSSGDQEILQFLDSPNPFLHLKILEKSLSSSHILVHELPKWMLSAKKIY